MLNTTIQIITDRIVLRSQATRTRYLARMDAQRSDGVYRAQLSCGNQAHAFAVGSAQEKLSLIAQKRGNLGIITAYNDMLSAHHPFKDYPEIIKDAVRSMQATAQVAGGVPAMCDGVTQGQAGMELSLFSRDVIALASTIGLSHNVFDAVVYLGVCDKIVPGLVIGAAAFGHLPAVFLPAGPMLSGLSNDEKSRIRKQFANGEIGRDELLKAEMEAYHGPGTCTFYGTANSNQMLMEFMGLHLPASSFINPNQPLREALTRYGAQQALKNAQGRQHYRPLCDILTEKAFVNAIVGLNATGGSTNHLLHLVAMARAVGIQLDWQDFSDLSEITPLLARVYPNGSADVNLFHAAGGLGFIIQQLLSKGLLHDDVMTVVGEGLSTYTQEPCFDESGSLTWKPGTCKSLDEAIVRPIENAFQISGGLKKMDGNLGEAVIKVSAVSPEHRVIEAEAKVFDSQEAVKSAFLDKGLEQDCIVVVRFQGPKANGMPELHSLTPILSLLQDRGFKVGLVTDGRMSGASGRIPAAIHVSPEALDGGMLAKIQTGDKVRLNAETGELSVLTEGVGERTPQHPDLTVHQSGIGRELFSLFRKQVGTAKTGASLFDE